jgi:hypothetical protein
MVGRERLSLAIQSSSSCKEPAYVVDLADWRGVVDRPAGSLHEVTLAVKDLTKQITKPAAHDVATWQDNKL